MNVSAAAGVRQILWQQELERLRLEEHADDTPRRRPPEEVVAAGSHRRAPVWVPDAELFRS
jgi:hypothetical protein